MRVFVRVHEASTSVAHLGCVPDDANYSPAEGEVELFGVNHEDYVNLHFGQSLHLIDGALVILGEPAPAAVVSLGQSSIEGA